MNLTDTIAAIATPIGHGGLGVIRISGADSLTVALKIFFLSGGRKMKEAKSHRLYFGQVKTESGAIDEACFTYMKEPRSYTRQDTVEISCHGSPAVLRKVLKLLLSNGARMAEPGEFTKRAFLNGRIDLSQAEGVIDLINARSEGAAKAAFNLMEGGLSARLEAIKERLVHLLSQLEASIDFPEEELETAGNAELFSEIDDALLRIASLIKSYESGRLLKHGITLAIIGKPNVGKSSLLNALLEEERAIVTPHPGTTRDLVHAQTELAGLKVELIDTAGLNPSPNMADSVEEEGIRRALKAVKTSDAVIGVFDGSREWEEADNSVMDALKQSSRFILVVNKSDLAKKLEFPGETPDAVSVSATQRRGLEGLYKKISEIAGMAGPAGHESSEEPVVTRTRHLDIFKRIEADLIRAREGLSVGREIAASSVWEVLEEIKRFTGESYTEEVLGKIFDEFCVGK